MTNYITLDDRFEAPVCKDCGFSSRDTVLMNSHSCDIQAQGGRCEDFPCCGHELGDCNGLKYGSDEAIKAQVWASMHDEDLAYRMERQAEYDEMYY